MALPEKRKAGKCKDEISSIVYEVKTQWFAHLLKLRR